MFQGSFHCSGLAISTIRQEDVPHVHDREDTRLERDLFAAQTQWIASAIPFLMMEVRDGESRLQVADWRKHFISVLWMPLHNFPFFGGERARLEQDMIGNAEFANIVQK